MQWLHYGSKWIHVDTKCSLPDMIQNLQANTTDSKILSEICGDSKIVKWFLWFCTWFLILDVILSVIPSDLQMLKVIPSDSWSNSLNCGIYCKFHAVYSIKLLSTLVDSHEDSLSYIVIAPASGCGKQHHRECHKVTLGIKHWEMIY